MKRLLPLLLLLLPLGVTAQDTLRLMTYNVRNAIGMDGRRNYWRVGGAIARMAPDVVALQELDSMTRRSGGRDVLAELAAVTRLHAVFAPAIDFDGGRYGVGLLSRRPPLSTRAVGLPGREEARVMLVAEFDSFVVGVVHLSLTEDDRLASLPIIVGEAEAWTKPFFVAGDWNDAPGSPLLTAAAEHLRLLSDTAVATYPSPAPVQAIDHVAVMRRGAERVERVGSSVGDERYASDHRPVMVELVLGRTCCEAEEEEETKDEDEDAKAEAGCGHKAGCSDDTP